MENSKVITGSSISLTTCKFKLYEWHKVTIKSHIKLRKTNIKPRKHICNTLDSISVQPRKDMSKYWKQVESNKGIVLVGDGRGEKPKRGW